MKQGFRKVQISDQRHIMDKSLTTKNEIHAELDRMKQDFLSINSAKDSVCSLEDTTQGLNRRPSKLDTNRFSSSFMNKNKMGLRKVLEQQKIKNIVLNFRSKLKRNLVNSPSVEYEPFTKQEEDGFLDRWGLSIPQWFDILHTVLNIILILAFCFIYPLVILFDNILDRNELFGFQMVCVLFYLAEFILNCISMKSVDGRKLELLREIFRHYLHRKFSIDLLCLILIIIDAAFTSQWTKFLRIIVLIKAKEIPDKIQKIENLFATNFYKEQYWALAKVFLVNFAFAHCLAFLLVAMSNLTPTNNWLTKLNAYHAPWYEQYTWGYYWGCTIMLTVGFGDLSATNYKQAICIILIETFSCILLAYNINCVGNLISNIRQQDIEKNKNLKILRRLAKNNDITSELQLRVTNYLDESDKMKKKFGFDAEKEFVSNLPVQLKADFLKESNIKIFENLRFFSSFTQKTLLALAQFIEVKIAHPQQIIIKVDNRPQFIILRDGDVAYCTKKSGHKFNGTMVDYVSVKKKSNPMVLDLNFLLFQNWETKFEVKSLNYSMIYRIELSEFMETLKNSVFDFQTFCFSRDKSKHIVDEYQVLTCPICSNIENGTVKHSKMRCPKLHFMPLKQLVAYKYLEQVKIRTCERQYITRIFQKSGLNHPLKFRKDFKKLEEQIYKGTTMKTMTRNKISRSCDEYSGQDEFKEGTVRARNGNIRATFDQMKLAIKLQKNVLEKIHKIFEEKAASTSQYFWDLESDQLFNFKFYFSPFNVSELHLNLNECMNKDNKQEDQKVLNALKSMKTTVKTEQFV